MALPARGGLEPHFRVLFSALFHVFPWGISIRVETGGSERKQKCGLLWRLYIHSFNMCGSSTRVRRRALISRPNVSNSLVIYPLGWAGHTKPLNKAVAVPAGSHGEIGFK